NIPKKVIKNVIKRLPMTIGNWALGLLLVLSPALTTPAHSRAKAYAETTIILAQTGISEGQAASMARSRYGGKVLSVSKAGSGDRVIYRVKLLLESGRVIIVTVDGQTGHVSG